MKLLTVILLLIFSFTVGCKGSGGAPAANPEAAADTPDIPALGESDSTPEEIYVVPTPPDQDQQPDPIPDSGPQPGEIVQISEGIPAATYPAEGTPVVFATDYQQEPNSDIVKPIISITSHPAAFTPNTGGTIQLWAADNENGSGLKYLECSIDGAAYANCDTQVDLANLSEGMHTITARAVDWDDNQSGEVSYNFYVDTTAPYIAISKAPQQTIASTNSNFEFQSIDNGSGVDKIECKLDNGSYGTCGTTANYGDLEEGNHTVSVRSTDNVGNTSVVADYTWTVDVSAPIIQFTQQPGNQVYKDIDMPAVQFSVNDTYSPNGVTTACSLNGVAVSCASDSQLSIPANAEQTYIFTVTSTDAVGNSTQQSIQWTAVNIAEARSTTVNIGEVRPVDILFVVDNSGSMDFERSNLAQRINGMMDKIDGLDWQIAVTSTDTSTNDNKSDGRLIEMLDMPGTYVLDSNMDKATAEATFGNTIQNFGSGSPTEKGIYASVRVIERYLGNEVPHTQFIRDGADLSIVVLSDEDENSTGGEVDFTPQEFVDFVDISFNSTKNMVFHSIILKPGDTVCKNGEGFNYGNTYDALSRLTGFGELGGAIIGSVCASNYADQLEDIGQSVKDLQNSIDLQCDPFDRDNDSIPEVRVSYKAVGSNTYVDYTAARSFGNQRVVFQDLLPPGDYKVDYECRIN